MQILFCEHMHIYTDTHTIAWYVVSALRKMCIMTPQFFCMGVGIRLEKSHACAHCNRNKNIGV